MESSYEFTPFIWSILSSAGSLSSGDLCQPAPSCAGGPFLGHSGVGGNSLGFMSGTPAVLVGKGALSELGE
jgi:hypothetical protein